MPGLRLFSEILGVEPGGFTAAPILGVYPGADVPVECGIWPIGDVGNVPVLDRIPMDIISKSAKRWSENDLARRHSFDDPAGQYPAL